MPASKYRRVEDLPEIINQLRERIREAALQLRTSVVSAAVTATGTFTASGPFIRTPEIVTPDGANEVTIDASEYHNVQIPLSVNVGNAYIINLPDEGAELIITWIQDNAGGRTYTWPAACKFAGASSPSNTTANSRTTVTFQYGGTYWWETSRAVGVI